MTDRETSRRTDASGFVLVAFGAALWGSDALFRKTLATELPATVIVAAEHLILTLVLLPVLWNARRALRLLSRADWVSLLVIGAGSSALATVLFTMAFTYGDPNTPLLLQKLQPLIAVAAAGVILGERVQRRFVLYLAGGLIGAVLITFPDPTKITLDRLAPALLALGSAFLWAMGTVLGRRLTSSLSANQLTASRLGIGLFVLLPVVAFDPGLGEAGRLAFETVGSLVLLALIPGLVALLVYYRGLRSTPASAAAIAELAFPLTAVAINYVAFGATLDGSQWLGLVILSATIVVMALIGVRGNDSRDFGISVIRPPAKTSPAVETAR